MSTTQLATQQPDQNPMQLLAGMDLANVDPEKLEKLLEIQSKWEDRQSEKSFNGALASFQADMPQVYKRRKESSGKYTYASYDDIMFIARPILKKNGLAISCSQTETEDKLVIEMTISHKDGHSRKSTYSTPKDGPITTKDGRKVTSEAQAQNSTNTYARRMCLCNALDIVVTDEDDNGQAAAQNPISEEQATEIYNLLEPLPPTVKAGFLGWVAGGVDRVEDIPAEWHGKAIKELQRKVRTTA